MLSLLSGLIDLSCLDWGPIRKADVAVTLRQLYLFSGTIMGAENERLFSEESRIPAL